MYSLTFRIRVATLAQYGRNGTSSLHITLHTRDLRGKTNMFPHPPLNCETLPSPALTLVQVFPHPHSSRTIISLSRTHPSDPHKPIYFPAISRIFIITFVGQFMLRLLHSLSNITTVLLFTKLKVTRVHGKQ